MTYAVGERAQPGPAGTQEAAQTHASGPSPQGIRAGVMIIDQFGPVYLAPMQGGAATSRVQSDPSASLVMIAETPPAGAAQAAAAGAFSEWWE